MTQSLFRAFLALAGVLTGYAVYAFAIVPMIEPQIVTQPASGDGPSRSSSPRSKDERFVHWFPDPRAWERGTCTRLQNERGILLFREYKSLGEGKLKLSPCTLIYLTSDDAQPAERDRQALILQAPQGAILRFDKDFDLVRGKFGKLHGGLLVGKVTIRGSGKSAGPEDDLLVVTYDVDLAPSLIATRHPVQFQYGPNHGSGSDLRIELAEQSSRNKSNPLQSATVESLSLAKDVVMDLLLEGRSQMAGSSASAGAQPQGDGRPTPLKVACDGPFHFDFVERVATFENRVEVLRVNETSPGDSLLCDLLKLHLQNGAADAQPSAGAPPRLRFKLQRLEAAGQQVILSAPSSSVYIKGERLAYDLVSGRMEVGAAREAVIRHQSNEIHGQQIAYQPGAEGRMGIFLATGEGWINWQIEPEEEGQPARRFTAAWTRQLHARPHREEAQSRERQLVSIEGTAQAGVAALGKLSGDEIHFWMFENPPPAGEAPKSAPEQVVSEQAGRVFPDALSGKLRSRMTPDRLLAIGNVSIESPQLTGTTERLEAWFRAAADSRDAAGTPETAPSTAAGPAAVEESASPAPGPSLERSFGGSPFAARSVPPSEAAHGTLRLPSAPARRQQQFNVSGDLIQADILLGEPTEIAELRIKGSAEFKETQTPAPGDKPLALTGDVVHAFDANRPNARVEVSGQPSHLEGRGVSLHADRVNFDRGQNRVWIDGPGIMTLLVDRDLNGRPSHAQPLEIRWQRRMEFDGLQASFDGQVIVRREYDRLDAAALDIALTERVDFNQDRGGARPQIQRIVCHDRGDGVFLQRQIHDDRGLAALEWLQVKDLVMEQTTGTILGGGPGWMKHVGRVNAPSGQLGGGLPFGPPRLATPPAPGNTPPGQVAGLTYVFVRFHGSLTGNTQRRDLALHEDVQLIYGQVHDWNDDIDPDVPEQLGENGAVVHSQQITLTEVKAEKSRPDGGTAFIVEATGNALVEGYLFTAQAERIMYASAQDLLVLEGDLRSPAQLWRQAKPGAKPSHAAARKIEYWRAEPRLNVQDARFFGTEIPAQPQLKKARPPKLPPASGTR